MQPGSLEESVAAHPGILAWEIPWAEKPGGATVQGVAKGQTQLKRLSTHAQPWYTGEAVPVS